MRGNPTTHPNQPAHGPYRLPIAPRIQGSEWKTTPTGVPQLRREGGPVGGARGWCPGDGVWVDPVLGLQCYLGSGLSFSRDWHPGFLVPGYTLWIPRHPLFWLRLTGA